MTLLDFYGEIFESEHPEGCTCKMPISYQYTRRFNKYTDKIETTITNRCSECGLELKHAQWLSLPTG
jgi:hypothetical protein